MPLALNREPTVAKNHHHNKYELPTPGGLAYNRPEMAEAKQQHRRQNRPRSVTLVAWGVFLLGLANILRAAGLFRQRDLLQEIGVWPDPLLSAVVAAAWAFLFVVDALAIWRGRSSVRLITPVLMLGYALYQLGFSYLGSGQDEANSISNVAILFYSAVNLLTVWALNRRSVKWYF